MSLADLFTRIEPFRSALLSMLLPFEISTLLAAISCDLDTWERQTYMDVLDDIFKDAKEIHLMAKLGMTVRILGSDLEKLETRLQYPCAYLRHSARDKPLYVFMLVTDNPNGTAALIRDYRPKSDQQSEPQDMDLNELHSTFSPEVASNIATLSKYILCAPYLAGTSSSAIPSWIPIFNTQPYINVRAYISDFQDRNARVLFMNRFYMQQIFGYPDRMSFLSNISNLRTKCYKLDSKEIEVEELEGNLTLDALHSIFAQAENNSAKGRFVVVNSVRPLKSCITLTLE